MFKSQNNTFGYAHRPSALDSRVLPNKRKMGSWIVSGLPVCLAASTVDATATARVIYIPVVECLATTKILWKADEGRSGYSSQVCKGVRCDVPAHYAIHVNG